MAGAGCGTHLDLIQCWIYRFAQFRTGFYPYKGDLTVMKNCIFQPIKLKSMSWAISILAILDWLDFSILS